MASTGTLLRTAARRNREDPSDLFNILLQIMDHGKLTDHNGKHRFPQRNLDPNHEWGRGRSRQAGLRLHS
jgi:hypothetical protein